MFRRQYVAAVGAGLLAGCVGSDDNNGSPDESENSPETPVVQHYEALDRNDFDAANAAIHSESEGKPLPDEAVEIARDNNYEIESIETDREPEFPVVSVTVIATNSETDETNTLNLDIEVREQDGVWKMFQIL